MYRRRQSRNFSLVRLSVSSGKIFNDETKFILTKCIEGDKQPKTQYSVSQLLYTTRASAIPGPTSDV